MTDGFQDIDITLDERTYRQVRAICAIRGISFDDFVVEALEDYIALIEKELAAKEEK